MQARYAAAITFDAKPVTEIATVARHPRRRRARVGGQERPKQDKEETQEVRLRFVAAGSRAASRRNRRRPPRRPETAPSVSDRALRGERIRKGPCAHAGRLDAFRKGIAGGARPAVHCRTIHHLLMGVTALAATLAIWSFTLNRLVKRKLRLSFLPPGGYVALPRGPLVAARPTLPGPDLSSPIRPSSGWCSRPH